jgi:hypothetical protein
MRGQADLQLVFIYLFSHADSEGFVEMIPEAIADDCGLSTDRVAEALRQLCEPDPRSRSPEQDGARLEPIDERGWGWQIVNYKYYRSLQDQETIRAGNRKRKQKQRNKVVTDGHGSSRQEEVEVEVEVEEEETKSKTRSRALAERDPEGFTEGYKTYPRRIGRRAASRAFEAALKRHPTLKAADLAWVMGEFGRQMLAGGKDPEFIPYPATWLNQDRFLEFMEEDDETQAGGGNGQAGELPAEPDDDVHVAGELD